MENILYIILLVVLLVGTIRVIIKPYTDFVNFLMEVMLLDWLIDGIEALLEFISDGFDI